MKEGEKQVFATAQFRGWIPDILAQIDLMINSGRTRLLVQSTKFQVYHQEFGLQKLPTKWKIPVVKLDIKDFLVDRSSCDI